MSGVPRLYTDLATWWPVFSPPSAYDEEAADLLPELLGAPDAPPTTLLELGSGGGSLAFHFKERLKLTLSDLSEQMLTVSKAVNPECEHLRGDMKTLDLGRQFDLVFIHDAIMYLTDEASLRAALATAHRHCRPGGAVVMAPDYVTETFEPGEDCGGEDGADGRALRYLEWRWDPNPNDTTYRVDYSFLLREPNGSVSSDSDHHHEGLFPRASWLTWMREAGFSSPRSRIDPWNRDIFVGMRPRR